MLTHLDQKGTSLIELMIAAALSTFIALMASLFLLSFSTLSLRAEKGDNIETDLSLMLRIVQSYALLAVNVRYHNGSLDGRGTGPNGQGYVRGNAAQNFLIDNNSDVSQDYTPLMFFAREDRPSRANPKGVGLTSQFRSTAIFYRRRNVNGQPPAVIINPGRTGAGALSAQDPTSIVFDYISDIRLDQPEVLHSTTPNLSVLSSIRFTAWAIYPTATTKGKTTTNFSGECYGPTGDIDTVCVNSIPYGIAQQAVILNFANNKRHTQNSAHEFLNGLYFFKPFRGQ